MCSVDDEKINVKMARVASYLRIVVLCAIHIDTDWGTREHNCPGYRNIEDPSGSDFSGIEAEASVSSRGGEMN